MHGAHPPCLPSNAGAAVPLYLMCTVLIPPLIFPLKTQVLLYSSASLTQSRTRSIRDLAVSWVWLAEVMGLLALEVGWHTRRWCPVPLGTNGGEGGGAGRPSVLSGQATCDWVRTSLGLCCSWRFSCTCPTGVWRRRGHLLLGRKGWLVGWVGHCGLGAAPRARPGTHRTSLHAQFVLLVPCGRRRSASASSSWSRASSRRPPSPG